MILNGHLQQPEFSQTFMSYVLLSNVFCTSHVSCLTSNCVMAMPLRVYGKGEK